MTAAASPSNVDRRGLGELELHVRRRAADGSFPVSARMPEVGRVDGWLRLRLDEAEIGRAADWMDQGRLDAPDVRELGARLFGALLSGPVGDLYRASRAGQGVGPRVRLVADDTLVDRVPWELLHDPESGRFLVRDGRFVRGVGPADAVPGPPVTPPARLLVVDAFPAGALPVRHQLDAPGIRRALARLARRRRVEVTARSGVSLTGLEGVLREAREAGRPFQLLHVVGHGRHDPGDGARLLLDDGNGNPEPVSGAELAGAVGDGDLRLVVLNVCQTGRATALDLTRELAPALLRGGAAAVIGMQATVLDDQAVAFTRGFYAAVGDGRPVEASLAEARHGLGAGGPAEPGEPAGPGRPGLPICYLRQAGAPLVKPAPTTPARSRPAGPRWLPRHRATLRSLMGALLALLSLVTGVIALYDFVRDRTAPPSRMSGGLNVAVARFGQLDAEGRVVQSDTATDLAASVANRMGGELQQVAADLDVQVRPPAETGMIDGGTPAERARQAQRLAEDHNVDVVLYGLLGREETTTSVTPEFYVDGSLLPSAEELAGDYRLGVSLRARGDPERNLVVREELRRRLIDRAKALVQFTIGLGYYQLDRFGEAEAALRRAAQIDGWEERDGKEVLYLFLGNVAGKRGRLDEARSHYERALRLSPGYARAMVGLAEVRYHDSSDQGTCRRVDGRGLDLAEDGYRRAVTARTRPALSDIDAKVAFGLGRVDFCRSYGGLADRWVEAEASFRQVIAWHAAGNARLGRLAAESWVGVALTLETRPDGGNAWSLDRQAADAYRRAIALTEAPERKGELAGMLGDVHARLGEVGQARAAYAEAMRLDPGNGDRYRQRLERLGG